MGYEAPEIRGLVDDDANQQSSAYTNAVDIWSLGCVIYKIMTKKVPFESSRDLRWFCDGRIPFPSPALEGTMSDEGTEFLKSLLKPKPLLRPPAAEAMQHNWLKLEEILDEVVMDASEMLYTLQQTDCPPLERKKPIRFKDCVGRKFSFPFHLACTWAVSSVASYL
jgi:serine/threonine protein kinase